jgi:hypothetical protein
MSTNVNHQVDHLLQDLNRLMSEIGGNDIERDELADSIEIKRGRLRDALAHDELDDPHRGLILSALEGVSSSATDMAGYGKRLG